MKTTKVLAQIISWIFHPALLALIILIVASLRSFSLPSEYFIWSLSIFVLNGFIPASVYFFFLKRGYIFEGQVGEKKIRHDRVIILLIFLGLIALQTLILCLTQKPQPLLIVLTGGLIALVVALSITYFWRISLHAGMITIFVIMLIYLYGIKNTWPFLGLIPLIFWARMVLACHTFGQLLGGFLTALLVVLATLALYGKF